MGAIQNPLGIVDLLGKHARVIFPFGRDDVNERLLPGAGRFIEHVEDFPGLVRVQLVDDGAMRIEAFERVGIAR